MQVKNALKAQIQPLLTYIANQTIDESWFNNHLNITTGRRAYLLGTAAGSFPSRGLWPMVVNPLLFSQFGGNVPANYQLVISHTAPAGSVIYYTIDGTDPRSPGGGLSPGARVYSGPVTLSNLVMILARVKNANGEWSPLTEAFLSRSSPARAEHTRRLRDHVSSTQRDRCGTSGDIHGCGRLRVHPPD